MREVTFVTPNGDMMIRMEYGDTRSICEAALTLKARYFVTADGFDMAENCPIWGVFDMRGAQKDTPTRGEWSIDDPIKTFSAATADAAVVYAVHTVGRG